MSFGVFNHISEGDRLMGKKSRLFSGAGFYAALLAILFALTGCGKQSSAIRIGVSIPAPTHGWAAGVVTNAEQLKEELEKRYPGAEVIVTTAKDSTEQASTIENLLMRGVNALVVLAQDPVPLSGVCKRAVKQGVFLVVVSNPLREKIEQVFVNGDNRSFGVEAARAMGKVLGGKGKILLMEGKPCPINNERVLGFEETLASEFPNVKIIGRGNADWSAVQGQILMENFLGKYPDFDGVWAGDDDVLLGALNACERSGRKNAIRAMVGGGGSKAVVRKILMGDPLVKATVTYSPAMIRTGIQAAFNAVVNPGKSRTTAQREILIPSKIITHENARAFESSPLLY